MTEIVEHREGDAARLTAADARRRGSAAAAFAQAETMGRKYGVQGTPAWLLGQRLIVGLRPAAEFETPCGVRRAGAAMMWIAPQREL